MLAAHQPLDMGTMNLHHAVQRSVSTGNPIADALLVTVLVSIVSQLNIMGFVTRISHTFTLWVLWLIDLFRSPEEEESLDITGQMTFTSVVLTGTDALSAGNQSSNEFIALLHEITEKSTIVQQRSTVYSDLEAYFVGTGKSPLSSAYFYVPCTDSNNSTIRVDLEDDGTTWLELRCRNLNNQGTATSPDDAEQFQPVKNETGGAFQYAGALSFAVTIKSTTRTVPELKKKVNNIVDAFVKSKAVKAPVDKYAFYSTVSSSQQHHSGMIRLSPVSGKNSAVGHSVTSYMENLISAKDVESCYTIHDLVLTDAQIKDLQFRLDLTQKCNVPLTILLTGVPGSGKTACVRAIQKYLDVHVVMPVLHHVSPEGFSGLFDIFFGNYVNSYPIKPQERMIALEEFDITWGRVMLNRHKQESAEEMLQNENDKAKDSGKDKDAYTPPDQLDLPTDVSKVPQIPKQQNQPEKKVKDVLTLADWLKVMDGPQKRPGQVLVLLSNEMPDLDPSVLRPGRIDVAITFGYLTIDLLPKAFASACSHTLRIQRPLIPKLKEDQDMFDKTLQRLKTDVQEQVASFIAEHGESVTDAWLTENCVTISSVSTQLKYNPYTNGALSYRKAVRDVLDTFIR